MIKTSEVKLPEWLARKREDAYAEARRRYDDVDTQSSYFLDGFEACYAALVSRRSLFNKKAAYEAISRMAGHPIKPTPGIFHLGIDMAIWQSEQDAKVVTAKDAEIERLRADVARLREALEGYAVDPTNYGQCAREALKDDK